MESQPGPAAVDAPLPTSATRGDRDAHQAHVRQPSAATGLESPTHLTHSQLPDPPKPDRPPAAGTTAVTDPAQSSLAHPFIASEPPAADAGTVSLPAHSQHESQALPAGAAAGLPLPRHASQQRPSGIQEPASMLPLAKYPGTPSGTHAEIPTPAGNAAISGSPSVSEGLPQALPSAIGPAVSELSQTAPGRLAAHAIPKSRGRGPAMPSATLPEVWNVAQTQPTPQAYSEKSLSWQQDPYAYGVIATPSYRATGLPQLGLERHSADRPPVSDRTPQQEAAPMAVVPAGGPDEARLAPSASPSDAAGQITGVRAHTSGPGSGSEQTHSQSQNAESANPPFSVTGTKDESQSAGGAHGPSMAVSPFNSQQAATPFAGIGTAVEVRPEADGNRQSVAASDAQPVAGPAGAMSVGSMPSDARRHTHNDAAAAASGGTQHGNLSSAVGPYDALNQQQPATDKPLGLSSLAEPYVGQPSSHYGQLDQNATPSASAGIAPAHPAASGSWGVRSPILAGS